MSQQEARPGSLIDRLERKLGIKRKKKEGKADPRKVPLGSGLANNAKFAITNRRAQIDKYTE